MHTRRLLLPLVVGCFLLISTFLFPSLQHFGPTTADAGTAATTQYVAYNGFDAGTCTNPDAPCRTIQYAVDSASAGDEIWVAAGVYTDVHTYDGLTQTVYIDKPLAIRGGFGPDWERPEYDQEDATPGSLTILDAGAQGRVIFITDTLVAKTASVTTSNAVILDRLDLVGGDAAGQGGDPVSGIDDAGGAIYATGGSVRLRDVFVSLSRAGVGGGAVFNGSDVHIEHTIFYSNVATYDRGGGLFIYGSPGATILKSSFEKNVSANSGGGLNVKYSDLTIGRTQFVHNQAYEGAGLSVYSSTLRMKRTFVFSNTASNVGGGVQLWDMEGAVLDNNAIVRNYAGFTGAGIDVGGSEAHLRHNTIADNGGGSGGTGLSLNTTLSGSSVYVTNTLISGHGVGVYADGSSVFTGVATLWSRNSDVMSGSGTFTTTNDVYTVTAKFRAAPYDYRLHPFSPAVDAGVPTALRADGEGDRRPYGAAPDIGADEVPYGFATPDEDWNFVYTDTEGVSMTMDVPAGRVVSDTRIVFTRNVTPGYESTGGLRFAGVAFNLEAYLERLEDKESNEEPEQGFEFPEPVTLTLRYRDADVADINEWTITLRYWNGAEWKDIAAECGTSYQRQPSKNLLKVGICHLSRWGTWGSEQGQRTYLPIVVRE